MMYNTTSRTEWQAQEAKGMERISIRYEGRGHYRSTTGRDWAALVDGVYIGSYANKDAARDAARDQLDVLTKVAICYGGNGRAVEPKEYGDECPF
jgi:hypothetical protein